MIPRPCAAQVQLVVLLLGVAQFVCFGYFYAQAVPEPTLPLEEVEALRKIDTKLKIGWNFSVNPCSSANGWLDTTIDPSNRNVTCGNCNTTTNVCHVISIVLKSQNLSGVLPDEFTSLTSLMNIDLTRNYINGTIPTTWGSLPAVQNISLLANRLSGSIPKEIGNISSLQSLVLEQNSLDGPLPPELGNLKFLSRLILSSNFFSGELPPTFAHLQNLIDIRIDGNSISGTIPDFIGNWTQLVRFDMQGTSMEGAFPTALSTLKNLTQLRVSSFRGNGEFPQLKGLKLKNLVLRNCSIYGSIPSYIGNMNTLTSLDLSFNYFIGEIPSSFGYLASSSKSISNVYFTNNSLTGSIPGWVWNYKNYLDLSYNSFDGPSPPSNCQQGNVNFRASYSSTFGDPIDPCLKKSYPCLGKAKNYNLFINCGGHKVAVGANEYEEDTLQIGASTFFLSPSKKWAFSSTGNFVDKIMANYLASNTSVLNMSNPELYMRARRSPLSLKYYGLCLQRGNYTVNLHFAEIMFTDDQTFASLGRRLFDVSIQNQKVLKDFNIAKEANGTGHEIVKTFFALVEDSTLEIHFQWAGKGTNSIPEKGVYGPLISAISVTPNFKPYIEKRKPPLGIIVGVPCGSLVALCFLCFLIWMCCRADSNEVQRLELDINQIELATENFSKANLIGIGGFASVYKGTLPDGFQFAVKKFSNTSSLAMGQFIVEAGTIMAVRHPNLVKLYGCCTEENQLLLLLEYMENKDLACCLFGSNKKLDWPTRRRICLQVAKGLAYLHECTLKIIHRDIKLNNILLDKKFNAKISDFGLAELEGQTTTLAGTIGYMAPEYSKGELTTKADVFSFGVVMLETISGKRNRPMEGVPSLLETAYVHQIQDNLTDLVDQELGLNYPKKEVLHMLKLALACTNSCPDLRPTMSAVVIALESGRSVKMPKNFKSRHLDSELSSSQHVVRGYHGSFSGGPFSDSFLDISSQAGTSQASTSYAIPTKPAAGR